MSGEQERCNAELYALAPEMAEALWECEAELQRIKAATGYDNFDEEVIDRARAILARLPKGE